MTAPSSVPGTVVSVKPLLFLDVDGVLNGDSRRHSEHHDVVVAAEHVPVSPFVGRPDEGGSMALTVRFDPRCRAWLVELSALYELVWATTWEHAANVYLAPLLGLDPLGVVEHSREPVEFREVKNGDVAAWKWRTIVEYAAGRPFAFVDDAAWTLRRRPPVLAQPTLILAPRYGLTRDDVKALVGFAATLAE